MRRHRQVCKLLQGIGLQKVGVGENSLWREFCGLKNGFWCDSLFSSRRGKLFKFRVKRKIVSLSSE